MRELQVYRRSDGLWDWRVKAGNNQVIATSGGQGYTERNDAKEAALDVFGLSMDKDEGFVYVEEN